MTIKEMIEKRAKVWETAKNFVDTHENENGVLSAEDNAAYSRMEQEIEDLTAAIDRQQRAEAREAELNKPVNAPLTGRPAGQDAEVKMGRASNAYKEDFGAHLRGKRLVHNVLSEGVQADGGYLVPEEFERQIVTGLDEANVVRGLAKVITTSAERKIPVAATHSAAQWTAENGAYTESNPTFDQKTIDAYKLTDLVKVSIELLQDSMFDLESYIANEFARAFGIAEEQAFCVGTGTGQPTGIFTANGGAVGVTAAANNAISADELISLVYMRRGFLLILGAFCALLAVIGIANVFFNTLGFLRQRKREFAQYMSVGMTPENMRKMFCVEALVIAGRPLLITLPLTVFSVGFMINASYLNPMEFMEKLPIGPILLFLVAIFGFVALAYYMGGKRLLNCDLADTLKNDSIG